jgi:hypothetical protein
MRRVFPDPDVLQMHLQLVVRMVRSTRNNYIQVLNTSKYLPDFSTIAQMEIVK